MNITWHCRRDLEGVHKTGRKSFLDYLEENRCPSVISRVLISEGDRQDDQMGPFEVAELLPVELEES